MNTNNFVTVTANGAEMRLNINHISAYGLMKHDILQITLIGGNTITLEAGKESQEALKQLRLHLINGR